MIRSFARSAALRPRRFEVALAALLAHFDAQAQPMREVRNLDSVMSVCGFFDQLWGQKEGADPVKLSSLDGVGLNFNEWGLPFWKSLYQPSAMPRVPLHRSIPEWEPVSLECAPFDGFLKYLDLAHKSWRREVLREAAERDAAPPSPPVPAPLPAGVVGSRGALSPLLHSAPLDDTAPVCGILPSLSDPCLFSLLDSEIPLAPLTVERHSGGAPWHTPLRTPSDTLSALIALPHGFSARRAAVCPRPTVTMGPAGMVRAGLRADVGVTVEYVCFGTVTYIIMPGSAGLKRGWGPKDVLEFSRADGIPSANTHDDPRLHDSLSPALLRAIVPGLDLRDATVLESVRRLAVQRPIVGTAGPGDAIVVPPWAFMVAFASSPAAIVSCRRGTMLESLSAALAASHHRSEFRIDDVRAPDVRRCTCHPLAAPGGISPTAVWRAERIGASTVTQDPQAITDAAPAALSFDEVLSVVRAAEDGVSCPTPLPERSAAFPFVPVRNATPAVPGSAADRGFPTAPDAPPERVRRPVTPRDDPVGIDMTDLGRRAPDASVRDSAGREDADREQRRIDAARGRVRADPDPFAEDTVLPSPTVAQSQYATGRPGRPFVQHRGVTRRDALSRVALVPPRPAAATYAALGGHHSPLAADAIDSVQRAAATRAWRAALLAAGASPVALLEAAVCNTDDSARSCERVAVPVSSSSAAAASPSPSKVTTTTFGRLRAQAADSSTQQQERLPPGWARSARRPGLGDDDAAAGDLFAAPPESLRDALGWRSGTPPAELPPADKHVQDAAVGDGERAAGGQESDGSPQQ